MDPLRITRHRGDYLWGSFYIEGADGLIETRDPATGVALDQVPWRLASVESAVRDAGVAAPGWGQSPLSERVRAVHRLRDILDGRREQFAAVLSRELGKPLWEARLECIAGVRAIELLLEQCRSLLTPKAHPTTRGTLQRRPMGTIAVLTPYPYPVFSPLQLILPCLVGGNAVVWKPSSYVPLTSQKLVEAFDAAQLPAGILSMVQGPRDPIGSALVQNKGIDMIVGAGSAALGDVLRDNDEERPLWVQTGGKGWAIVCSDADLDRAAYEIVSGAFLTAGQRCNATSRLMVERDVAEELLRRIRALTSSLNIAPPTDPDSFCGPLVDSQARSTFQFHLDRYREAGVDFVLDGGHDSSQLSEGMQRRGQAYVAPAIALLNGELPQGVSLPEEVEGPLLVLQLVDDAADAVAAYNSHPYGLAAAIFTSSENRFHELARDLRAGAVNWNRGTIVASVRFPNAGLRRSGKGAEGNAALLLACTWAQSNLAVNSTFDPSHRVPGMRWPEEMGTIDPTSLATPPYRPDDDTMILPPRRKN
jgi:acyl-CoA reductase-like NAD-dependent aldehyde dehydrogenase